MTFYCLVGCSMLVACMPFLYGQTWFVRRLEEQGCKDKAKDRKPEKRGDVSKPHASQKWVGPRTRELVDEVLADLDATEKERAGTLVYHCDSLEPISLGCLDTMFGGTLGLPLHFEWEAAEEVELDRVVHKTLASVLLPGWKVFKREEDEAREGEEEMRERLILPKEAKKFAVAFEVLRMREKAVQMLIMTPLSCVLAAVMVFVPLDTKLIETLKHGYTRVSRFTLAVGLGAMYFGLAVCVMNYLQLRNDEKAMAALMQLERAPEYAAGCLSYADATSKRGLMLRERTRYGDHYHDEAGVLKPSWVELTRPSPEDWRDFVKKYEREKASDAKK